MRAIVRVTTPQQRLRHAFDAAKAAQIYRKTGNLRAVQLLLGHTKIESTVRYLGIETDDALTLSEQVEL
jgi:site-specific recombinase XerC